MLQYYIQLHYYYYHYCCSLLHCKRKCQCNNFVYVGIIINQILFRSVHLYFIMALWWMLHWQQRVVNCRLIKLSYQHAVHIFRWLFKCILFCYIISIGKSLKFDFKYFRLIIFSIHFIFRLLFLVLTSTLFVLVQM